MKWSSVFVTMNMFSPLLTFEIVQFSFKKVAIYWAQSISFDTLHYICIIEFDTKTSFRPPQLFSTLSLNLP